MGLPGHSVCLSEIIGVVPSLLWFLVSPFYRTVVSGSNIYGVPKIVSLPVVRTSFDVYRRIREAVPEFF